MESTMIDKKYGDKPIHFEVSLGKLFVGGYRVIEIPLLINIDIRMRSSCRENHIGSVMVSMLVGLNPGQVKPKTMNLVLVASLLTIQH